MSTVMLISFEREIRRSVSFRRFRWYVMLIKSPIQLIRLIS